MSREVGRGRWSGGEWASEGRGALTLACGLSTLESQTHHGLLQGLKKLRGACSRYVSSDVPIHEKQNWRQDLGRARLSRNHPGFC